MLLGFKCYECGVELEADVSRAGSDVDCPQCGEECRIPSKAVRAGVTIGGFHVEKQLGVGGMGEVYLATQLSMDREVALKILPEAMTRKPEAVERFLQEVRMAAKVNHPHIVTAFEAGEDAGIYYLAMQYVDGHTLAKVLRDDGPMHEGEALRILDQLADALEYAWDKHALMHRDIKPANIMIDQLGDAHLMDMGLSKTYGESQGLTLTGEIMGSPNYMSPEQAEGLAVDTRTDMFSLGATFYHMLSGEVPFYGSTIMETMRRLAVEDLPDPALERDDLGPSTVQLMQRMGDRDSTLRPGNWADLRSDLAAAREGRPVSPRPTGSRRANPAAKNEKVSPWLWIAVLGALPLLMLVAAALVLFAVGNRPASDPIKEPLSPGEAMVIQTPDEPLTEPNLELVSKHLTELRYHIQEHPDDRAYVLNRLQELREEMPPDDWIYLRGKLAQDLGIELVPVKVRDQMGQRMKDRGKLRPGSSAPFGKKRPSEGRPNGPGTGAK